MPVKRLKDGKKIVGTMLRFVRNPGIAYIAKHAGLDFIMLDMEHGSYSLETLANCETKKYYNRLQLTKRVMDLPMPTMKLVDLKQHP